MDSNSWAARLSSASKSYRSALQSRSGMKWDGFDAEMLMGFEEIEMDDDTREEYPCPFCSEYFDIVGLCCHINDEHPVEAKNGVRYSVNKDGLRANPTKLSLCRIGMLRQVCPVCAMRVGVDMVAHITLQHGSVFKMQRKRKSRKASSHSTLSLLRRELRDGNLQSLFRRSSYMASSNAAPDPLLSSFISPMLNDHEVVLSHESTLVKISTTDTILERKVQQPPMSIKDQEEKAKRCEFVKGLLLSTMLDDNL